jgi:hypothetical protein
MLFTAIYMLYTYICYIHIYIYIYVIYRYIHAIYIYMLYTHIYIYVIYRLRGSDEKNCTRDFYILIQIYLVLKCNFYGICDFSSNHWSQKT